MWKHTNTNKIKFVVTVPTYGVICFGKHFVQLKRLLWVTVGLYSLTLGSRITCQIQYCWHQAYRYLKKGWMRTQTDRAFKGLLLFLFNTGKSSIVSAATVTTGCRYSTTREGPSFFRPQISLYPSYYTLTSHSMKRLCLFNLQQQVTLLEPPLVSPFRRAMEGPVLWHAGLLDECESSHSGAYVVVEIKYYPWYIFYLQ